MKRRVMACSLFLILSTFIIWSPAVLAQAVTEPKFGTWEAVKGLQIGQELELRLKNGTTLKGTLNSVSDSEITFRRNSQTVTARRDEIRQIYTVVKKGSRKAVALGAIVGGAIGAGGTVAVAASNDTEGVGAKAALLPVVGALTGALVGWAFRSKTRRVLVFENN